MAGGGESAYLFDDVWSTARLSLPLIPPASRCNCVGTHWGTCAGPVGAPGPKEPKNNAVLTAVQVSYTLQLLRHFDRVLSDFGCFWSYSFPVLPPTPLIVGAIVAEGRWGTRGGCMDGSEPKEPRCNSYCCSGANLARHDNVIVHLSRI